MTHPLCTMNIRALLHSYKVYVQYIKLSSQLKMWCTVYSGKGVLCSTCGVNCSVHCTCTLPTAYAVYPKGVYYIPSRGVARISKGRFPAPTSGHA